MGLRFYIGASGSGKSHRLYEYIIEENLQNIGNSENDWCNADLSELLYAKPEQIKVSSKLLQYLAEEGIIEWKN